MNKIKELKNLVKAVKRKPNIPFDKKDIRKLLTMLDSLTNQIKDMSSAIKSGENIKDVTSPLTKKFKLIQKQLNKF